MHIGFDISQTGKEKAGCGYYAHAMMQSLLSLAEEHRYSLFPSFGDFYFDDNMPVTSPYSGQKVHYGPRYSSKQEASDFWCATQLETAIGSPDIVHSNNFWCPRDLASSRLIYTFYDMAFLFEPSWTTETNRIGCFEGVFRSALAADWVVAISKASKAHYLDIFPHFPAERVRVIYPCSRFQTVDAPGTKPPSLQNIAPQSFWLSVGTIEPRKNQRQLVEAYARYHRLQEKPLKLVFAGKNGWLMDDFETYIKDLGLSHEVITTGYVADSELTWLYQNCFANLYPSFFEGFGLPVLEGMQFGAATVASCNTSIPEITGNAAILLDPKDTDAWAQAMLRLHFNTEERQALCRAASAQAMQFSWQESAQSLLQLYNEALLTPKRQR